MVSLATSDAAGGSDTGRWRASNQDSWCIDTTLGLAAVADGMGGHARGEEASRTALDVLVSELHRLWDPAGTNLQLDLDPPAEPDARPERCRTLLLEAIEHANRAVHARNESEGFSPGTGMGTTLTGIWFVPDSTRALVFNIGDSRVYRLAASTLVPLTVDHTLYREWEDAGCLGAAPPRNIILRALGLYAQVNVDVTIIDTALNDRFLMCSDGLTGMVNDRRIGSLIEHHADEPADALCRHLIEAANQAGGEDNITVVLINCND